MKNKVLKVAIVVALIITLAMTDFILLGVNLVTYALENIDKSTNSDNVKFAAYFKTEGAEDTHAQYEINSEEMKLYLEVAVQNEGYFDGVITLQDSNFKIKQSQEVAGISNIEGNTITLDRVRAGNTINMEIAIEPVTEESYGENMLSKESVLKLTGKYIDSEENSIDIDTDKSVTLTLEAPSNLETTLEGKAITNKVFEISGENKRIVQIELNSSVIDNSYPIKNTTFEVILPEGAKEVSVIAKETYATNGEADRVLEEGNNYTYDEASRVLTIYIENTSNDGKISWKKDAVDSIIVTLTLAEDAELGEEYTAKAKVEFYGQEAKTLEKETKYSLSQETDGVIRASTENKEEIYKGKIYSKEEREYSSTTNIEVNYADLIDGSTLEEKTVYGTESEDKEANVEYKTTVVKKSEIEKVLGEEGTLTIRNDAGEEITKITNETETDENGYITITYTEGVKTLNIEITKAVETGVIRLNHTKVIKEEGYSKEEIDSLRSLVEKATVKYNNEVKCEVEEETELKDIAPEVGLTVIPETISAESNSREIQMAITLKTDNEKYELFSNPTFTFTLPDGVTVNSLSNGTISATTEGLSISKLEAVNSKEIILELSGEQEKYITSNINTQINFTINVDIEKLMPNKVETIKMQYTNKEKTYSLESENLNIIASNSKVVTHIKLENYNGAGATLERYSNSGITVEGEIPLENTETIQVPVKYTIINNYDSAISTTPAISAEYIDKDGNKQLLINYAEQSVVVEANSMKVIEDTFEIPAGLYFSEEINVQTLLEYNYSGTQYSLRNDMNLATETKQGLRDITVVNGKIQVETFAQFGDGTGIKETDEVYNEQIIEYIIEVTNVTNETISNLKVTNTQENGNIYDLKEVLMSNRVEEYFEHTYDELDTNIREFEIGALEPGESKELICRVVAKKTEENNITTANISISADEIEEQNVQTISNPVKEAELKISSKKALKEEVPVYGNDIYYVATYIENLTNKEINDTKIKMYITEGLTYSTGYSIEVLDEADNSLDIVSGINYNEEENYIEFDLTKLEANQEITIMSSLYIKSISLEIMAAEEAFYVTANDIVSNSTKVNIEQAETEITVVQSTNIAEGQIVKDGETVIIIGEVSNVGYIDTTVVIEDRISNGLEINKVELIKDNEVTDKTEESTSTHASATVELAKGEKATIRIETTVNTSRIVTQEITNIIYATPEHGKEGVSNEITIQVDNPVDTDDETETEVPDDDEPENNDPSTGDEEPDEGNDENKDPDNPTEEKPDDGNDNENPDDGNENENPDDGNEDEKPDDGNDEDEEKTYTISGYAWNDINQNDTKDKGEGISYVIVKIIDINNKNTFLKDKNGNEIEVKTSEDGSYKIEDIPKGSYNIIFKYDTNAYELKTNESIKDYIIESTKEKVAITNNINLNSDRTINLQLEELTDFDLKVDKYISKVIVQTSNGTKTTEYANKQLVREEVQSKYLSGATILVEYTIQVTNIGELAGYATEIIDYLPSDMKFHSELNTQWYIGDDGNLYNTSIASSPINPGETKTIKLVLLKTMTKENTGTTSNIVELSDSMNIKEYDDINSNNNQSKAEIIVNPATGTIITYIIAILNAIAIVAVGMYAIKKKVVGKEQI